MSSPDRPPGLSLAALDQLRQRYQHTRHHWMEGTLFETCQRLWVEHHRLQAESHRLRVESHHLRIASQIVRQSSQAVRERPPVAMEWLES